MAGVQEEDSGAMTIFPASFSLQFELFLHAVLLVIWNAFFEGEIAELNCFWHKTESCFKGVATKNKAKPKKP